MLRRGWGWGGGPARSLPSWLGGEGRSREARRQIVARHRHLPSGTFINYSHLFPLSVGSTGQPSAAIVFLKALVFFLLLTHASHQHKAERKRHQYYYYQRSLCVQPSLKKGKLMHIEGCRFLPGSQRLHTKRCGCCRFVSIVVSESASFSFFFFSFFLS